MPEYLQRNYWWAYVHPSAVRLFERQWLVLLHEQPPLVRRQTIAEALRVVKPGGKLVIVDYHRPAYFHLSLLRQDRRRVTPRGFQERT